MGIANFKRVVGRNQVLLQYCSVIDCGEEHKHIPMSRELGGDIGRGIGDLIKMTAQHSLEGNSTHLTTT